METVPTMMRVLGAAVNANVPTLIWGNPGVGKTAKIEAHGQAWGRDVRTISASSREPVDFMGLPMEVDGRVVYSPLSWALELNNADKGLLVVDEITTAADSFKAFLRIVQERYVGELKLNDTVSIVAIANPPEIAVDGVDLAAPIANRFLHLDWQFDFDQWVSGVGTGFAHDDVPPTGTYLAEPTPERRAHVVSQVTGFLKANPELVNKMPQDFDNQGKAWPSARAWTNLIDVLTWIRSDDDDARDMAVAGLVGQAAMVEFLAWLESADLVEPAVLMDDPSALDYTERPDRVFAALNGVTDLAQMRDDEKSWNKAIDVMVACSQAKRPDLALSSMRRLLNMRFAQSGIPSVAHTEFRDLLVRMGRLADDNQEAA